ncbi:uncharacterized protein LOC116843264 [Odontomachus brunneus]|uniref:uncharacterized protein LOC116843264 n=1 Tax=Odontomachus brunneus TaxID=486640 RepID=UPI0013F201A1|nr:uncharacterized protein LOC116843264 [Odontomachus brunneus]XP_032669436.1 uncharacterized protein LOC116843264 [Odontomachus brunneus]
MELQEKSVFAQEKPLYDAIPLIIFDNVKRKNTKGSVKGEDLKYNVSSPICMTFRLLLFWVLWTALVIAIVITIFAHFWFTSQHFHHSNTHKNVNVTDNGINIEEPRT